AGRRPAVRGQPPALRGRKAAPETRPVGRQGSRRQVVKGWVALAAISVEPGPRISVRGAWPETTAPTCDERSDGTRACMGSCSYLRALGVLRGRPIPRVSPLLIV